MPHSLSNNSSATRSRPSSTSTNPPTAFPREAGATLLVPESGEDQLSPLSSTFSFDSSPKPVQDVAHGMPMDDAWRQTARRPSAQQFFMEQFGIRDEMTMVRDRVTKDAPIVAELRTNVIIKDEYTLVIDLSQHLSQRYQRPESSIMIVVNHSACLLLGGSFEPTYVLTISALPNQVKPATNKRNAALTQNFLHEAIGVAPERGIMKFVAIPEECLAIGGETILGEIERLERKPSDDSGGRRRSTKKSIVTKAKSSAQLSRDSSRAQQTSNIPHPEPRSFDSGVAVNDKTDDQLAPLSTMEGSLNRKASRTPQSLHENNGNTASMNDLVPPPIPEENSPIGLGKRKSLLTIFKR
ncbi:Tautomerase/MIF [Amniculicola lignicola CBS 123094]|uniref:L-dopachrome isomerase n=1 Tax=Amniculicola lignicola CBS 123094 TaxID=1392246 RepID=A0A6A5W6L3_9PLEO|nr:Tautomerase/MIF [Amniculicola lignicola CBS 123094]